MKGARYFTKLDLVKGYLQLPLTERASKLCTVVTMNGAYQCWTMPFGVKNGPQVFQHRISTEVLRELDGKGVESFVDDMCVYSETFEEHVRLLREVLPACVLVSWCCMVPGAVWVATRWNSWASRLRVMALLILRGARRHSPK